MGFEDPLDALIFRRARSQKVKLLSSGRIWEGGKMRILRLFSLALKVGAALAFLFLYSGSCILDVEGSISTDQELMTPLPVYGRSVVASISHRKLKDRRYHNNTIRNARELAHINAEDYPRFDPVPSSKTIHAGPIEHGTPLMPYIPRPTPPNHPKHGSP